MSTQETDIDGFELDAALPRGRMAIEASAGTGKTYALSTLAARYVAEHGIPVRELLIVTFTRAAAAELKDRVRRRLVEFGDVLRSETAPEDDLLLRLWSTDRDTRRDRVGTALAEFDQATITTIHGFAQQVIGTLGSNIRADPDAVLVDDSDELTTQVSTDTLVTEILALDQQSGDTTVLPSLGDLDRAAKLVLGNPDSAIQPGHESAAASEATDPAQWEVDRAAQVVARLVESVVDQVGERRRRAGTLSFDDLLVRLRDALVDPVVGPPTRELLRRRYSVALIDEFQDTDPVQWAIFDSAFGNPGSGNTGFGNTGSGAADTSTTLMLVGDPKQAIYTFRGANVHTYLRAVRNDHTDLRGLTRNWRSDPAVIRATERLLSGVTFGDERITFQSVDVPERHAGRCITDSTGVAMPAVSVRLLEAPSDPASAKVPLLGADDARKLAFDDMARHLRDLLEHAVIPDDTRSVDRAPDTLGRDPGSVGPTRPLRPDDIAVLIPVNAHGPMVRDALADLGIPAVIARGDSVLDSEAHAQWHRLLHAVERPGDARRARSAATSWFFGWDAARVVSATDGDLAGVQEDLRRWSAHLHSRGVASFLAEVVAETSVAERVLALTDGDRSMTDVEHVAELLSAAARRNTSAAGLLATFEELGGSSGTRTDADTDTAARRVESEASAVQIMTTFVAKGLEFPVVCCPNLWHVGRTGDPIWWDAGAGRRTIDVAARHAWGSKAEQRTRKQWAAEELDGTNLRVLYVALTRARHHTALWWAPTRDSWKSALARVLFGRDEHGNIEREMFGAKKVTAIDTPEALRRLEPLAEETHDALEVEVVDQSGDPTPWRGAAPDEQPELSVAVLGRELDRGRARLSFSAITARGEHRHHGAVDPHSENLGDSGSDDEGVDERGGNQGRRLAALAGAADEPGTDAATLPLGDIPGGAAFGTLVHSVLETVDFAAEHLETTLRAHVVSALAWNPWPVDIDTLVEGIAAVIRTPLGPLFEGRCLADLPRSDRLDELAFDLTLGEGGNRATDADIGRLVLDHLGDDDPHRSWAEGLADGPFSTVLAGHLTGSIDLLARVRGAAGTERFVVTDYKTNRLAARGEAPTAGLFRPDRLPAAMAAHDYQLQALLYSVAVHRYLRWRIPGYAPSTHLGGIGYMFLRGMVGPDTPTLGEMPYGLAEWHPPPDLVIELSDLLDGSPGPGTAARGRATTSGPATSGTAPTGTPR